MFKILRNKLFLGVICLLLSGVFAFVALPRMYNSQSYTTEVIILKQNVGFGTTITDDMLTAREVGSYGLPDSVVKNKSEIAGLVAGETLHAGEYLCRDNFVDAKSYKTSASQNGYGLSAGQYLLTISLPSESSGIAGILRAGAIVDVYGCTGGDGAATANVALTSVKVYKVFNSKLLSLDELDSKLKDDSDKGSTDYDFAPAYVVFTVNEQQAKVLIALEKDKSLHLTLRETEVQR